MGILTANFRPASLIFLREVRFKIVNFCRFFFSVFVKYIMVVTHFDIFIENNFFGCLLLQDDQKKIRKRYTFFGHVNLTFYKISDCPTLRTFIQHLYLKFQKEFFVLCRSSKHRQLSNSVCLPPFRYRCRVPLHLLFCNYYTMMKDSYECRRQFQMLQNYL